MVRVDTDLVRMTAQRAGRPLIGGKLRVEGRFQDVAGDRLHRCVGAGEHGVTPGDRELGGEVQRVLAAGR